MIKFVCVCACLCLSPFNVGFTALHFFCLFESWLELKQREKLSALKGDTVQKCEDDVWEKCVCLLSVKNCFHSLVPKFDSSSYQVRSTFIRLFLKNQTTLPYRCLFKLLDLTCFFIYCKTLIFNTLINTLFILLFCCLKHLWACMSFFNCNLLEKGKTNRD